jgi:uncharacterized SAM-binding protein YcdF (DUF218 family)
MYVYLSKILPLFLMPLGVTIFLALLALLFVYRGNKRLSVLFIVLSIAYLWVLSTPMVGKGLYRSLESHYPPVPMSRVPEAGCMVVLGGVVQPSAPPRVDIELNEAVDRVYKTAELFHAGKAPYVIVTGGNQPWSKSGKAEAELIQELLMQWGVPEDVILLEGSSRNTRENALYTKNLIDSIHCEDALLVTSAAHMPRALGAFRSAGVNAKPVSTDVRVANSDQTTVIDFLPDARALEMSSDAIRELVGQWVYRMKGWN